MPVHVHAQQCVRALLTPVDSLFLAYALMGGCGGHVNVEYWVAWKTRRIGRLLPGRADVAIFCHSSTMQKGHKLNMQKGQSNEFNCQLVPSTAVTARTTFLLGICKCAFEEETNRYIY
eukprot:1159796-Pelagomonas_calceolata.AAC.3